MRLKVRSHATWSRPRTGIASSSLTHTSAARPKIWFLGLFAWNSNPFAPDAAVLILATYGMWKSWRKNVSVVRELTNFKFECFKMILPRCAGIVIVADRRVQNEAAKKERIDGRFLLICWLVLLWMFKTTNRRVIAAELAHWTIKPFVLHSRSVFQYQLIPWCDGPRIRAAPSFENVLKVRSVDCLVSSL